MPIERGSRGESIAATGKNRPSDLTGQLYFMYFSCHARIIVPDHHIRLNDRAGMPPVYDDRIAYETEITAVGAFRIRVEDA